jgi:AcrR family transcriptional regulator
MEGSTKRRRRHYQLGRRAETTEETKRRLVEATFQLHSEQGIAGTTMKDIAARAGVSVGTVYHHFPTYVDAIHACGAWVAEHEPAPSAAVFEGAAAPAERVRRLAQAMFAFYERVPAIRSLHRDRQLIQELGPFADAEARNRRALAEGAVGVEGPAALLAALLDIEVYRALKREGFSTAEAAERLAALINRSLESAAGA